MKLSELNSYRVVGAQAPEITASPKKDLLDTAADISSFLFPGEKIGQALGTAFVAGKEALKGNTDIARNIAETAPKPLQVIGDAAAGAATVAGFKGVGTSGGFLSKALQSAGLGAVVGGGSAAAEGGDAGDIATGAAIGGAVGGATSAAFSGVEAALKNVSRIPERLVRSATGQSTNEIVAGKDISKYIIENKRIGTADQLIKSAQEAIDEADTFIGSSLASVSDKTVPLKDIIADVTQSINTAGGEVDDASVRSILSSLAPQVKKTLGQETLTLAQANQLRSQLDKILGNRAFINTQLPFNKGILMDVTNALREQVKGNAPEGVRQAFDTLSKEMKLRDLITRKVAQGSRNQIIGFGDLLSGGVGGVLSGGLGGVAIGAAAKRAGESTLAKTGGAVLINKLDQSLSPVLQGLEPGTRTAIVNAIVQALTSEDQ